MKMMRWVIGAGLLLSFGSQAQVQPPAQETNPLAEPPTVGKTSGPAITPGLWEIEMQYSSDAPGDKKTQRNMTICYTEEMAKEELDRQLQSEWSGALMPGFECAEIGNVEVTGQRVRRSAKCSSTKAQQDATIVSDYRLEGATMDGTLTTKTDKTTMTIQTIGKRVGECPAEK